MTTQFELTEQEREWALAIKNKLTETDPDLAKSISDFEYAQHAIVAKDQVTKALRRIRRLKAFKQEYNISEATTVAQAKSSLRRFEELASGFYIGFGREEGPNGRFVISFEYRRFEPAKFENEDDWNTLFSSLYHLLDASQPDLKAMRNGIAMIGECQGLRWKNFSLEIEKRGAALYQDAYPVRITQMSCLNSSIIMKLMYALCKPFLSKRVKEVFKMDATLAEVKATIPRKILPTTFGGGQAAMDMASEIQDALKVRYENKATFKL